MWYKIIDGAIAETSGQTPKLPGISNAGSAQLNAAGWWQYADLPPAIQAQIDAEAAEAAEAHAAAEIERKATPLVYDQPIEVPALVLPSHEAGVGVGVTATDEGYLVTFVYHSSPIPGPDEIKARKDAATAARRAARQAWRNNAGHGQLQARIEALEAAVGALIGVTP